jgi:hypothetical protein
VARKRVAQSSSITAPIGGLNARDSLAAMPPQDAVTLDNWFPTPTTVDLRSGYLQWSTGYPSHVESLMPYITSTVAKLFAASGTSFYDATSTGAVGAAVVTGLTNARWQSANMGTPGGQFFYAVNGVDKPRYYDNVAWVAVDGASTPAITGVTTTKLVHVNVFKRRLWFVEVDSMRVWYLPVDSIGGAAQSIDFSPIFKLGGYLMAMATWTIDNAQGVQEYAVFITSEGEIAVYEGYDPSTISTWNLVAVFRIGRPVGRRCFEKVGADLILVCSDGAVPLSKAMLTDRAQPEDALSNKIVNLVNSDVASYGSNFGWDIKLFPLGNKLIINVPQTTNNTQYQYVMNTITGAWCRFTAWNANCFAVMRDVLYFGGNLGASANTGYVAKADTGFSDNGGYIFGEAKTAFQYFGAPGRLKRWTMVRPTFLTSGTFTPAMRMDVNFEDVQPTETGTFSGDSGVLWNTTLWNTAPWGSPLSIKNNWQGISGMGYEGALHMRVVNNLTSVQWMSIDYVYEMGAIV